MTSTERLHPELHATPAPAGEQVREHPLPATEPTRPRRAVEPEFFRDLNLDQAVEAIVAGRDEYELQAVLLRAAARHRHGRLPAADLPRPGTAGGRSRRARVRGGDEAHPQLPERSRTSSTTSPRSSAGSSTRPRPTGTLSSRSPRRSNSSSSARPACAPCATTSPRYTGSEPFHAARRRHRRASSKALDQVRYTLRIKGARVTVSGYHDEADYTIEVEDTFARFREHAAESHLMKVDRPGLDGPRRGADRPAGRPPRPGAVPCPRAVLRPRTAASSTSASPASTAKPSSTSPTSNTRHA